MNRFNSLEGRQVIDGANTSIKNSAKEEVEVELEFLIRDCGHPLLEGCVYLLAITVGLFQLDEVLVLYLPTKGIVLGDTTQGSTLNDNLVGRNFQHHTDNGTLWNEDLGSIHYPNVNEVFVKSQMDGEKGYLEYR
ncbi:hypothetical protein SSAL8618_06695 [Streptococcus salivarius]|nr:hypothetical protein SSAL8618_06695 [Streptococcus salivarius]